MATLTVRQATERAAALYDAEVALREAARRAELDPGRVDEARLTFLRASGLRRARLELLRRCQIL